MRHSLLLLLLSFAAATLVEAAPTTNQWEKEIQAFERADRTNAPPPSGVLFIGSSSIRLWKTLATDFSDTPVLNRGFGGSHMADSVQLVPRIVWPYAPRLIVIYAGANDIAAGKTPQRVLEDYKAFVAKVREKQPMTRIAFISIAPNPARWAQIEKVREANRLVQEEAARDSKLSYIDVHSQMLGEDGKPLPDIFVEDRLHMNEKGYAIWKRVIGPLVQ